jgi:hypothetical protein
MSENGSEATKWFGVGRSSEDDPSRAAREALGGAIRGENAKLLIVFCSDRYALAELVSTISRSSGGVPLIGCSTAGEIATSGPGDSGLVIVALGGEGLSVSTAAATNASERLRDAGAEAAGALNHICEEQPHKVLMLLTDGLAGDQQEIVRGAYSVAGAAVPLVGGCAGDDMKMQSTAQFHGDQVLTNAVVAAAIASDAPLGIGVRHGWRRVGEPMVVTTSSGHKVHRLDDQPAFDAYADRLGVPSEVRSDPGALTAFALTHPLGLSRRSGEEQVRFVGGADLTERSLSCIAEVPQGALVWLMEGDEESVLNAADDACGDALAALGGRDPIGLITFDCIARRGVLGDRGIDREVSRIAELAKGAPVAGFYTYGEIARTHGPSGFHNQTLVVLAIS